MKQLLGLILVIGLALSVYAEEKAVAGHETPVKISVGGQAWVETEAAQNMGYDSATDFFNKNAASAQRQFSSLVSIFEIGMAKGDTSFNLNLQVGELYFGDPSTGGSYLSKTTSTNPFYVRDAYLTHNFNEMYSIQTGVQMHSADPNGFIMADHMGAFMVIRKGEKHSQHFWLAKMTDGRANKSTTSSSGAYTADSQVPDSYGGFSADGKLIDTLNYNVYGVYRTKRNNPSATAAEVGAYSYTWLGGTFDYVPMEALKVQLTGISNSSSFRADGTGTGSGDASSYLADARLVYNIGAIDSTLTVEGLLTSGSKSDNTFATYADHKNFVSISPKTSYLLTIACNDGADDAAGAPKQLVAPLDHAYGLNVAVVKFEHAFGKLNTFVRYGKVMSAEVEKTTKSADMGDEIDLQASYDLDKATQIQFDWAQFTPGRFYNTTQRDVASLLTTSLKFKF